MFPLRLSVTGGEWEKRIRVAVAPLSSQRADPIHGLSRLKGETSREPARRANSYQDSEGKLHEGSDIRAEYKVYTGLYHGDNTSSQKYILKYQLQIL